MSAANTAGNFRSINFYDNEIKKHDLSQDAGAQWDAMIMYHFKIDTEGMADEKYFKLCAQLQWVIEQENKKYENKD